MLERSACREEALAKLGQEPALARIAARIATFPPGLSVDERDDVALLVLAVLVEEQRGSTFLPLEPAALATVLARLGEAPRDLAPLVADARLEVLFGPGHPLVRVPGGVASHRAAAGEVAIAHALLALAREPRSTLDVPESVLADPVVLNEEQREAVARASSSALTVVTGGPGTGKTSVVAAVLRAWVQGGIDPSRIALAAPTGKAAQRMSDALRSTLGRLGPEAAGAVLRDRPPEPSTLHRLLAFHPERGRFGRSAADPIEADAIVVDEASMVDLVLMRALLDALAPGTRLVLLGDADQLPSVGAGAVLRDLVPSLPEVSVRLRESYRMDPRDPDGRHVLVVAGRTIAMARDAAVEPFDGDGIRVRASLLELQDRGVELFDPGRADLDRLVRRTFDRLVPRDAGAIARRRASVRSIDGVFAPEDVTRALELARSFDGVRLLCPVNEGEPLRSVVSLNERCHALARERIELDRDFPFLVGEPVMVTRNDATHRLWNGDQGIVLWVSRDGAPARPEAIFPRGEGILSYPIDAVADVLVHAYALTVHKAQGSELDHVVLVLPSRDHPLVTSEILYTAITRARRAVTIVASPDLFREGAARTVVRYTRLASLLAP